LPSGRTLRGPGPFVKTTAAPIAWTRSAPEVGEHTGEVLDAVASVASGARKRTAARAGGGQPGQPGQPVHKLPLEGVKVADFSWIGVGPITAKALADHGATVVH